MGRPTGEQRLEMIRLAIAGEADFLVDARELSRAGPSFTFDTISELAAEQGTAAGGMSRMTLLIGADQLAKLYTWHRVEELLAHVGVGVLLRPGVDVAAGLGVVRDRLGEAAARRLVVLETPLIEISATEVRRRVGAGLGVSYFVPGAVAEFISRSSGFICFDWLANQDHGVGECDFLFASCVRRLHNAVMRLITPDMVLEWASRHPDAKNALGKWMDLIEDGQWKNLAYCGTPSPRPTRWWSKAAGRSQFLTSAETNIALWRPFITTARSSMRCSF